MHFIIIIIIQAMATVFLGEKDICKQKSITYMTMCHSCTNLVHGIVSEVYYLHEVCHSCTNLVHGIVPEVCYLHEVCHSCTNLVHGIVPRSLLPTWSMPLVY